MIDFKVLGGFVTDRRTDRRTDIGGCRVAFATEKLLFEHYKICRTCDGALRNTIP